MCIKKKFTVLVSGSHSFTAGNVNVKTADSNSYQNVWNIETFFPLLRKIITL